MDKLVAIQYLDHLLQLAGVAVVLGHIVAQGKWAHTHLEALAVQVVVVQILVTVSILAHVVMAVWEQAVKDFQQARVLDLMQILKIHTKAEAAAGLAAAAQAHLTGARTIEVASEVTNLLEALAELVIY
jgi:hypothetical protein